jgi:hypothetical protein
MRDRLFLINGCVKLDLERAGAELRAWIGELTDLIREEERAVTDPIEREAAFEEARKFITNSDKLSVEGAVGAIAAERPITGYTAAQCEGLPDDADGFLPEMGGDFVEDPDRERWTMGSGVPYLQPDGAVDPLKLSPEERRKQDFRLNRAVIGLPDAPPFINVDRRSDA